MSDSSKKQQRTAGLVRKLTVPPILILYLVIILALFRKDVFPNPFSFFLSLFLLGILPVLAYPIQKILPVWKTKGRQGQRTLAFAFTFLGYTIHFITTLVLHANRNLMLVASTYFLSVVLLSVLNLFTPLKASGHACSITGPSVLLSFLISPVFLFIGILLAVIVCQASLTLKRHTIPQFLGGIAACIISFILSLLLYF